MVLNVVNQGQFFGVVAFDGVPFGPYQYFAVLLWVSPGGRVVDCYFGVN